MPDKKDEINEAEMEQASGGGQYNLSAQNAGKTNQMSPTSESEPAQGTGHLDPITDLESVRGGVGNISAQNAGSRNQMSPTARSEEGQGTGHLDPTGDRHDEIKP